MNMVGHQHVAMYRNFVFSTINLELIQINPVIIVVKETNLFVISRSKKFKYKVTSIIQKTNYSDPID